MKIKKNHGLDNLGDESYIHLLNSIKQRIKSSQHQVAMYVNSELLFTYWNIGYALNQERDRQGWGAKVVDQIAKDLKISFPEMKGISKRNLQYMMRFASEWEMDAMVQPAVAQLDKEATKGLESGHGSIVPPIVAQIQSADNQEDTIVPQPVAQFQLFEQYTMARVPWSHHRVLLDKIDNQKERQFYCEQIIVNQWSRSILMNKIDQGLYESQGKLTNNFVQVLPSDQSALVKATFKDPYFFDFLQLGDEATEREIEDSLTTQIGKFLLELGSGFAYMGRQYKLEVGGQEYYLDLLFFHTKLNCYVNIELKIDAFKPEYAGKSQFYLTAIDEQLKSDHHNPSVGIILCKEANNIVVEYTLKQTTVPLGVAEYKLVQELPEQLKGFIPTAEQLKANILKSENPKNPNPDI
jgi:predicted nuclease of restriction endonuclease-like (RecB) superfamily